MDFSKIIIVPKLSKYEWDLQRYRLSPNHLLVKYKTEGVDVARVLASHERQKKSFAVVKKFFRKAAFLSRRQLTRKVVQEAKMVISLGGDNHFQYVSHFVTNTLMVGINSDPDRSEGALNSLPIQKCEVLVRCLREDNLDYEEWMRIQVVLNGKLIPLLAVSEIYMGESLRRFMSRHRLMFHGKNEEQKSSGLLVSTGAGSTGWYDSACRFLYPKGNRFRKAEKSIRFLSTEPYDGKLTSHKIAHGKIKQGEILSVRSLNDTNGVLSIDCQTEYPFREGSVAVISIGHPLKVLSL
jgi:NAD+ kinase